MNALVAIDIGNSSIGVGLFRLAGNPKSLTVKKISSSDMKSSATLADLVERFIAKCFKTRKYDARKIGVAISSVVPDLTYLTVEAVASFCQDPLIITYKTATGLTLEVSHPERLGADRIVNAFAAYKHVGKPVAVVDAGTATTITVVGRHFNLIGGTIMPGIDVMRRSLASDTAKLPFVSLSKPFKILGRSTDTAIASGIVNGTAGAIERIVRGIEIETRMRLSLVLTGGRAGLISPLLKKKHIVIPDLIFEGLRLLYSMSGET
jgi:type III pantothenate kinase